MIEPANLVLGLVGLVGLVWLWALADSVRSRCSGPASARSAW